MLTIGAGLVIASLLVAAPVVAADQDSWPGTSVNKPIPKLKGLPVFLAKNLANFDDLDFFRDYALCRPYTIQKLFDFDLEQTTLLRERRRGSQHLCRGRAGFARALIDVGNVGCNLGSQMRRLLNALRNIPRHNSLSLHRACNRRRDLRDTADRCPN